MLLSAPGAAQARMSGLRGVRLGDRGPLADDPRLRVQALDVEILGLGNVVQGLACEDLGGRGAQSAVTSGRPPNLSFLRGASSTRCGLGKSV